MACRSSSFGLYINLKELVVDSLKRAILVLFWHFKLLLLFDIPQVLLLTRVIFLLVPVHTEEIFRKPNQFVELQHRQCN